MLRPPDGNRIPVEGRPLREGWVGGGGEGEGRERNEGKGERRGERRGEMG